MYTRTLGRVLFMSTGTPRTQCRSFHASQCLLRSQHSLPAAYYRGGTSRAVMFKRDDLPKDQKKWPAIFRGIINSPDPNGRQLDGIGGGVSSLSKVCVVGISGRDDADVDYTFAAIGVNNPTVDFSSNCGNMIAAVGSFAIESGQVQVVDGQATVRIYNTNSKKIIHSSFPVKDGEAEVNGSFELDGVAGTGAKIELAFKHPAGSKTGKTLPTGNITDVFEGVEATCIDVSNPCIFVQASDMSVEGGVLADAIEAHPSLLARLDVIRRKAAVAMGIAEDEQSVPGSIPKIAIVSAPHDHTIIGGHIAAKDCDLIVRALSVGQPHRAVPVTVAMALAVASKLRGSTVHRNTSPNPVDTDGITIGHNSGKILVGANFDKNGEVEDATVFRTARRIMEGTIYWKADSSDMGA